jgi:sarcosine oxidase, subunit beta
MRSAEIVIIGGGVVGASVAWHLAMRGCRDVLVLDAGPAPGTGSTGRATGGFRTQFGSAVNVRLSLTSLAKLRRFREDTGTDPGYEPVGYLFVAESAAQLHALDAARTVQRASGMHHTELLDPGDVVRINPAIRCSVAGGSYNAADGYIRPLQILHGYASAATALGVRFEYGVRISGFDMEDGALRSALTNSGVVTADVFVNAAGPWAASVAALVGVDLPVRPLRRQVASTAPTDRLPTDMPMTVFLDDGFHLRVRDGRVLLLRPDTPAGADPFDTRVDEAWIDDVASRAVRRMPCLQEAHVERAACWAGLYEMSPDGHALLGRHPAVENFIFVNGCSGHGVMHAPALGEMAAGIIAGDNPTDDVRTLRVTRFADGEPVAGSALL